MCFFFQVAEARPHGSGDKTISKKKVDRHGKTV